MRAEGGWTSYTEFVGATLYIDYMSGNAVLINLNFLQRKTKIFIDTIRGLQNVIFQIGPKTQGGYALMRGLQNEQNLEARGAPLIESSEYQ